MFSEVSHAKWRQPNAIPGFPMEIVSTLVPRFLVDETDKRSVEEITALQVELALPSLASKTPAQIAERKGPQICVYFLDYCNASDQEIF